MSAPLPLITKPGVGTTNWHPPMWAVIDRVNELAEIIRDITGAALLAGSGISITPNDAGDSIIVTNTATADTEQIIDAVAAALVPGNNNFVITYDDVAGTITMTAQTSSETVRDTMGTALVAGSGITITPDDGADTITIAATGGGSTDPEVVRDTIAAALTAGTGVTVTPNDGANTITIAATVTQYTDEMARDALGTAIVAGNSVIKTVNDAGDTITLEVEDGSFGPEDHGFLGWTSDPAGLNGSDTLVAAGAFRYAKVRAKVSGTVNSIVVRVNTAGVTLANTFLAVFNTAGTTRHGLSADQSTAFQSTGVKTVAMTAGFSVVAGTDYIVGFLVGSAGTLPQIARAGQSNAVNIGLAAPNLRFASVGSGLTAVPSTIDPSTAVEIQPALFFGLKT